MTITLAGIPGGYGYMEEIAPAGENIIPDVVKAVKENDPNLGPFSIQTMSIQVGTQTKVSINNRLPVLIQPDIGLSFDVRGTVYSLVFEDAVPYNIAFSY